MCQYMGMKQAVIFLIEGLIFLYCLLVGLFQRSEWIFLREGEPFSQQLVKVMLAASVNSCDSLRAVSDNHDIRTKRNQHHLLVWLLHLQLLHLSEIENENI